MTIKIKLPRGVKPSEIGCEVNSPANLELRFSDHILALRRRMRDDPSFRELCTDYEEAVAALTYWLSPSHRSEKWAEDYRVLVSDLETEIEAALKS